MYGSDISRLCMTWHFPAQTPAQLAAWCTGHWLVNYGHKDCILRRIQSTFFLKKLEASFINLLSCIKLKEESSSAFCFFWEQDFIKRDLKLPPCKIGTELRGRNPENSWKVIEEMYFDMLSKKKLKHFSSKFCSSAKSTKPSQWFFSLRNMKKVLRIF